MNVQDFFPWIQLNFQHPVTHQFSKSLSYPFIHLPIFMENWSKLKEKLKIRRFLRDNFYLILIFFFILDVEFVKFLPRAKLQEKVWQGWQRKNKDMTILKRMRLEFDRISYMLRIFKSRAPHSLCKYAVTQNDD